MNRYLLVLFLFIGLVLNNLFCQDTNRSKSDINKIVLDSNKTIDTAKTRLDINKILLDVNKKMQDSINTKPKKNDFDTNKSILDTSIIYDRHPQDIPADKGFYIRSTDGKSFMKIYGSIKLNGAYDVGGLKTKQTFSTYDIPTGSEDEETRFFMSPYQSRIGFEVRISTYFGIVNMKLESDFLGSGNSFRIRHAYGTLGNILLGQTWSVFGDPSSVPNTVDLDGPNSSVSERTIQVRYEPKNFYLNWTLAVESPNPDITNPDSLDLDPVFQSFPDITSRIKFKYKWGYVRCAGIFRSITVRNADNSLGVLAGYGILFSSRIEIKKSLTMNFQLTGGKAISRYITGLTGKGQDVIFDPVEKTNKLLASFGGFISGSYKWNKKLTTDATIGLLRIINHDFQSGDSFKESYYFSVNAFYNVIEGNGIGIEYSFGKRINKDGTSGIANRISFIGYMNF